MTAIQMAEVAAGKGQIMLESGHVRHVSRSSRSCLDRMLLLMFVISCLACFAFMEVNRVRTNAHLQLQIVGLQTRLQNLEAAVFAESYPSEELLRSRRSVDKPLRTVDGVPILTEPYGLSSRPTSEGLRIYETFSAEQGSQPTAASVTYETDNPSILPHHRSSAAFAPPSRFGRVNTGPVIALEEKYPTGAATNLLQPTSPATPANSELFRPSRVQQTRDRPQTWSPAAQPANSQPPLVPIFEARGAPTEFASPPPGALTSAEAGRGRQGRRPGQGRGHGKWRRVQEHLERALSSTAAHYQGNTSNYSLGHPHYSGNGLLLNSNPDAMFYDWQPAEWMSRFGYDRDFRLYGGQVTVQQPGVYHIYAQINYLDDSDINGFEIQVNARSLVKCITMEASDSKRKANTCYTAATTYLEQGDAISIRDLEARRYSMLLPDRSFFGLFKLAGTGPE